MYLVWLKSEEARDAMQLPPSKNCWVAKRKIYTKARKKEKI